MNYFDAIKYIKTGDVLLGAGNWFMSKVIRFVTKSSFSHVGVAIWICTDGGTPRLCMFEAMEGRDVRIIPLLETLQKYYWNKNGHIWVSNIKQSSGIKGQEICDFFLQHWSDGYANPYQFLIGVSPGLKKLRRWLGKTLDTDINKWHCSEITARAFESKGYILNKDPAIITPGDISKFTCLHAPILLEDPKKVPAKMKGLNV